MFCSKCGTRVEVTNKYCPECANPIHTYGSNSQQDFTVNTEENNVNFQNAEQTQHKRMNIVIRIVLCVIWLLLMAIVHTVRKKMGISGIIPNIIEGILMVSVIRYIWNR